MNLSIILAIVQIIATIVTGIIAFFLKRELNRVEGISRDLGKFKTKVAEEYVRKDDYNRANGEIMHRLDTIQEMLITAITGNVKRIGGN